MPSVTKTVTLENLRKKLLNIACAETSCNPNAYRKKKVKSPLYLHCLLQVVYGGDIVSGKVKGVNHYWNRLPDGKEIDLTSCQFNGDGFTPLSKGRKVTCKGLTPLRFIYFAKLLLESF